MSEKASFKRLKLYSFKLNALLEITQAINDNLSISHLLKRYETILKDALIYTYGSEPPHLWGRGQVVSRCFM